MTRYVMKRDVQDMTTPITLRSYTQDPASGNAPRQAVIFLHGLGADGHDLLGLAPYFAEYLPDAVFIAPDAPFPCDMAPYGYQWFSLQKRDPQSLIEGVEGAAPIVSDLISDVLARYGLPADKLALVGFSQGTMMSLYAGPRPHEQIGAIVGYSGALVWPPETVASRLNHVPVALYHGEMDAVVPLSAYKAAVKTLEEAHFDVEGETFEDLDHAINSAGIRLGGQFLQKKLG